MKTTSLILAFFSLSVLPVFAEVRVTAFGIFDPGEDTRISYNVETENGVETRSETLKAGSFSNPKELNKIAEKLGSVKFVLSPTDAEEIEATREFTTYSKPEPKATNVQFKTRVFNRVKTLIIAETRKYYKKEVPKATMANGASINAGGGTYVLVDKQKHPLGTLIISYETEFVCPQASELESLAFFMLSEIPSNWQRSLEIDDNGHRMSSIDGWRLAILPSGEKVLYKWVGKFYRCVGYNIKTTVTYTFNKLRKEESSL